MASLTARARQIVDRAQRLNPNAVDAAIALAFTAAALWIVAIRIGEDTAYRDGDALGIVLLLLQTLPLAVRRVAPLAALAVCAGAVSLYAILGYQGVWAGTFAALILLFTTASLTDLRHALAGLALAGVAIVIYFAADRGDSGALAAVTTFATYSVAWGIGVLLRSRREYTAVVEERASLLERDREVRAREAVADERARIARELHDIVGHALNLIVIQSSGAQRVFETKPEVARETLASIESTGRNALGDMERMLGMLRSTQLNDDALSPQPGLSHVDSLAAQVSEAGLPVDVTVEGTPVPLPSSIELSAYRIIQEALTNALKHAGPAHACVSMRYRPDTLAIEITDDGQGLAGEGNGERKGGRGLIGMRERVGLFGGQLSAGPRPEGGFRVSASFPLRDGAA